MDGTSPKNKLKTPQPHLRLVHDRDRMKDDDSWMVGMNEGTDEAPEETEQEEGPRKVSSSGMGKAEGDEDIVDEAISREERRSGAA